MSEQREKFTPFEAELKPERVERVFSEGEIHEHESNTLRGLANHPEKIIREERRRFNDAAKEIEYLNWQKQLFLDMEGHGFKIPHFNALIGKNKEGADRVFVVVDRVEGRDLEKIIHAGEYPPELDECLTSVLNYSIDALRNNKAFYTDMGIHQLRYGHEYGKPDQPNQYYMVDIETGMSLEPSDPDYYRLFVAIVNDFLAEVKDLEKNHPDWNLSMTRKRAIEFLQLWRTIVKNLGAQRDRFLLPNDTLRERLIKMKDSYPDALVEPDRMDIFIKDERWLAKVIQFIIEAIHKDELTDPEIVAEYEENWKKGRVPNRQDMQLDIEKMKHFIDKIINHLQHGI
jgi:hypothetical protein